MAETPQSQSRNVQTPATATATNTDTFDKMHMQDLNEHVILKSLDNKKTYYNSILSEVKPKFRYKLSRANQKNLDKLGYSMREDLTMFTSFSKGNATQVKRLRSSCDSSGGHL